MKIQQNDYLNMDSKSLTSFFALAVLILSSQSVSALTIQPLNSALQLDVWADADTILGGPAPEINDTDRQTQANTLGDLNVSADALSSFNGTDARSYGTSSAMWVNPTSGNYSFSVQFEILNTAVTGSSAGLKGINSLPDTGFSYEFMTDGNSVFSLDYSLAGSFFGTSCILCSFFTVIDGVMQSQQVSATGTVSFDLLGSGIHSVQIGTSNLSITDTISGRNTFRDLNGAFAWELRPVPVPAAVWLFGSGLIGLIGVARRKKS